MATYYEVLKKERLKRKLTQEDMAEFLKLNRSTYSLYESGKRTPKQRTLDEIAKKIGYVVRYNYKENQYHFLPCRDEHPSYAYVTPDPEQPWQPSDKNRDEKENADPLAYENSYSYASSAEELDKRLEERKKIEEEAAKKAPRAVDENGNEIRGRPINFTAPSRSHAQTEAYDLFHSLLSEDWEMTQEQEITAVQLRKMLGAYNSLNNIGRKEAVKRVDELTEIPRYTAPDPDDAPQD